MLTKEQREYRRKIKEIKKEKGDAYYEMYSDGHQRVRWDDKTYYNNSFNTSRFIRNMLFFIFIFISVYRFYGHVGTGKLGTDTGALNEGVTKFSPFGVAEQKSCINYVEFTTDVSKRQNSIFTKYTREIKDYNATVRDIERLQAEIDRMETVRYGENLESIIQEKTSILFEYVENLEELNKMKIVRNTSDRRKFNKKVEHLNMLQDSYNDLVYKQNEERRRLLDRHKIYWTETGEGPQHGD